MRIVQINICPNLSTGNVMMGIARVARSYGYVCMTASAPKKVIVDENHYVIGNRIERKLNITIGKIIGYEYKLSWLATRKLINRIKHFSPDIVHLHNMHSYYVNLKWLVDYLNKNNIKVVWTFHDCWPITGHCPHFLMAQCDKWHSGCVKCPQYKKYPYSLFDTASKKYIEKRKIISGINNLTVVTPSIWLSNVVKESYLASKDIVVINNGIDLEVFKPTPSPIIDRLKKTEQVKYILLGVASEWDDRKGLDIFIKLSKQLDSRFKVVLVGTNDKIDELLPTNILSLHHTSNKEEMAGLYSNADVFVNPTREDTFPTVNMEALACGTPVITFNSGGSPEIIPPDCGSVVEKDDVESLIKEINRVCLEVPFDRNICRNQAVQFDMNERFKDYVSLYERILSLHASEYNS